jgi:uncharacterized membrane protein YqjE
MAEPYVGASQRQDDEPTVAQLLGGLVGDAQTLVRKEVELATQEVKNEIDKARQGAVSLGIGGSIAAVGAIFLLLMIVNVLVEVLGLSYWVSYLIVGGAMTVIGVLLLVTGSQRLKEVDPMPRETIESVKKDIEWLQKPNQSDKI